MTHLNKRNIECGFDEFMRTALTFPPAGPLPPAPDSTKPDCNLWEQSVSAAIYVNPCFNIYHVIDFCPYLWDQLGFPSFGWGPNDYFNRSDVQKAINAPPTSTYNDLQPNCPPVMMKLLSMLTSLLCFGSTVLPNYTLTL